MMNVRLYGNDSQLTEIQLPDDMVASRSIIRIDGRYFGFSGIAGGALVFRESDGAPLDVSGYVTWMPPIVPSLQVSSGQLVSIINPEPEEILFRDIAASLSKICRYNGHTVDHYSVAEHSVLIYRYLRSQSEIPVDNDTLKAALLHDAPEYLIGDMTKPFKKHIGEPFTAVEGVVWLAVASRFGISPDLPNVVRDAHARILFNEKDQVFLRKVDWGWKLEPLPGVVVQFWNWRRAYDEYMECALECGLITEREYLV